MDSRQERICPLFSEYTFHKFIPCYKSVSPQPACVNPKLTYAQIAIRLCQESVILVLLRIGIRCVPNAITQEIKGQHGDYHRNARRQNPGRQRH